MARTSYGLPSEFLVFSIFSKMFNYLLGLVLLAVTSVDSFATICDLFSTSMSFLRLTGVTKIVDADRCNPLLSRLSPLRWDPLLKAIKL